LTGRNAKLSDRSFKEKQNMKDGLIGLNISVKEEFLKYYIVYINLTNFVDIYPPYLLLNCIALVTFATPLHPHPKNRVHVFEAIKSHII
jgi:predicted transport protein